MNAIVIPPSLDAVDQSWVEAGLAYGAQLPPFRIEPLDANNSHAGRLIFEQPFVNGPDRTSCILKLCPEGHTFLGASEPNYYSRDYLDLVNAPIPQCYAAIWAGGATAQSVGAGYALFVEDLGADFTDNMSIAPDKNHAAGLGHALGVLHAHRWGAGADPERPHDLAADFQKFLSHVSRGLAPVLDEIGDTLSPTARKRMAQVFDHDADRMLRRAQTGRGLTLVHGDPNPTNVLTSPKPPLGRRPLYLIDRQPFDWSLRLWLGASDLVYAATPFWSVEDRRAHQMTLLSTYHRTLLENGVLDYAWEDLMQDWEICACIAMFTAVEWGSTPTSLTQMKWLWSVQLHSALALLEDVDAGFGRRPA